MTTSLKKGAMTVADHPSGVLSNGPDRARVDAFIHEMDLSLKLVGAETMANRNVFVRAARYSLFTRSDHSEMKRLIDGLTSYRRWPELFGSAAEDELHGAEEAERAGHPQTAGDLYLRAAGLFHAAQINLLSHNPRKRELQARSSETYRLGAAHYRWPTESVTLDTSGGRVFGVFRKPEGGGPFPCVVMVNGANSVKEEVHYFADFFLQRGMATFVIECPGQGEAGLVRGGGRLRVDEFGAAIRESVEWAAGVEDVDSEAIGLWGLSWGGFLVLRWLPDLPQVRASVSLGGFFDLRRITHLSPWLLEEFCTLLGFASFEGVIAYITDTCSLEDYVDRIDRPYLVVHGALDDLLDEQEAEDMVRSEHGELWNYPAGVHCCYNLAPEVSARVADWMKDRLTSEKENTHA